MRALPASKKLVGLVACWQHGLMLPRGWLRVLMFVLRSPERRYAMALELYAREPAAILDLWDQAILHMLTGHDREEASSVGGFSQREMDILVGALGLAPAQGSLPSTLTGAR
ncbi:hypothetical protein [Methylobacterium sp. CM6244]